MEKNFVMEKIPWNKRVMLSMKMGARKNRKVLFVSKYKE